MVHSIRARCELSLVPSRAMTPPALKRPTGWPSNTHIELAVDLLDPGHPVPERGRGPLGEEVGRLAPVRVGVDDEHVLQH